MLAPGSRKYAYTRPTCGPFLRYGNCDFTDPFSAQWTGSVLFICDTSVSATHPPALAYIDNNTERRLPGQIIETFMNYEFWRFDLMLRLSNQQRAIKYWVALDPACEVTLPRWEFFIPGSWDTWRWGAYSCSGFSLGVDEELWGGKDQPLWADLLQRHKANPIHALVGGGDQLYNDEVFEIPLVSEWLGIKGRGARHRAPFTEDMRAQVELFYFEHYCTHFMATGMREALAAIPNVMMWDDHDIFDGWGSYPDDLLCCPVFEGLYQAACKFYLLFQQHTSSRMVEAGEADLFAGCARKACGPHRAYCFVKMLGPDVALVGADTRAERSKRQVMSRETWDAVCRRLREVPACVRHVVVLFTVPIIYPKVPVSEGALEFLGRMNRFQAVHYILNKTGIFERIMAFDEPEPLDDLVDHWTATAHTKERARCVESLQRIAIERGVRVTFLSGDVHCAAVGRFYSNPKVQDLSTDPNFMPQIITSAIVNNPPPAMLVRMFQFFSHSRVGTINSRTREKMVRTFKAEHHAQNKILARRNWLEVEAYPGEAGALAFRLRVEENPKRMRDPPKVYTVCVPMLCGYGPNLRPDDRKGSSFTGGSPSSVSREPHDRVHTLRKLMSRSFGGGQTSSGTPLSDLIVEGVGIARRLAHPERIPIPEPAAEAGPPGPSGPALSLVKKSPRLSRDGEGSCAGGDVKREESGRKEAENEREREENEQRGASGDGRGACEEGEGRDAAGDGWRRTSTDDTEYGGFLEQGGEVGVAGVGLEDSGRLGARRRSDQGTPRVGDQGTGQDSPWISGEEPGEGTGRPPTV
ncbi:unnamed protein product [Ostreobium quekettii]|uniref:PhoD-like phosphatase domain-containing protein n=1 Tax=Ostreobium quekettii TaxID=121088 RepID=A0A8S1J361_9CHLO|nr:unnamed protein product [Ostreobium quekettii]|eukprot:evm.model.scf_670EXC.2 EVM.evm.TU.scf_670EXC.2   scf_670EXC:17430-23164(-)